MSPAQVAQASVAINFGANMLPGVEEIFSPPVEAGGMRYLAKRRTQSIGWLRAADFGAKDGIVATASVRAGVAGAGAGATLMTGVVGLVVGAMSMPADEYVSVLL